MIRLIAAIDAKRGIAKQGFQPWSIPADETYFLEQTKLFGGNILVGGTTFRNALKGNPLPDRTTYLLTRQTDPIEDVTIINDLEAFLKDFTEDLWVIGGANVYEETLKYADELYVTEIEADFKCDQFFPDYKAFKLKAASEPQEQNGFEFSYQIYVPNKP